MDIFTTLFWKLIPLYIIILLGFIAGKFLHVKKESISTLAIYLVAPVVIFNGVYATPITISSISLPILVYVICCILCLLFFTLGKRIWKEKTANLLGFSAGNANTGYFGLPVAIALFPTHLVNLYIVASLGTNLYENSLGFFIAAKGHHSAKEALKRLLKLTPLYAFFLGLFVHAAGIQLGQIYLDTVVSFKGAFVILGMMIIGLGLSGIEKFAFDLPFTFFAFVAKFLAWPLMIAGVYFLNSTFGHFYAPETFKILLLLSVVPMAANVVAFSTQLNLHPEKAAISTLASTLFALFYIPLIVTIFIK